MNLNATVIRKHQFNSDNNLVISGDMSKGGAKTLFANGKIDTWDLRVDGQLNSVELLKYADSGKTIHLFAEAAIVLNEVSEQALLDVVNHGGRLVVWGDSLARLSSRMQGLLGISSVNSIHENDVANGEGFFREIKVNVSGDVSAINQLNAKASVALKTGHSVVAIAMHQNEFTDKFARIFVIGMSPSIMNSEDLSKLNSRMDVTNLSFKDKLKLAKDNENYLPLVIDELKEEISDDDIRTDVKWFKNNEDKTKLASAIDTFLAKGVKTQEAFVKYLPVVYDFSNVTSDPATKNAVWFILRDHGVKQSWWKSVTWKGAFCDTKAGQKRNDICEQD